MGGKCNVIQQCLAYRTHLRNTSVRNIVRNSDMINISISITCLDMPEPRVPTRGHAFVKL